MKINYTSLQGTMPFVKAGEVSYFLLDTHAESNDIIDSLCDEKDISFPTSFMSLLGYALLKNGANGFSFDEDAKVLFMCTNDEFKIFDYLMNLYIGEDPELLSRTQNIIINKDFCNLSDFWEPLDLNVCFRYAVENNINYIFFCDNGEYQTSQDDYIKLHELAKKYNIGVLYGVTWGWNNNIICDFNHKFNYNIKIIGNKNLFIIENYGYDVKIGLRLLDNGILSPFKSPGSMPSKSIVNDMFKTLLTVRRFNCDKFEYEVIDMPKYQNELIRLMTTTQINGGVQSNGLASHIISYAEAEKIIEKTYDKELIATCNTKQSIHNHKAKKCSFAYKYIGE